MVRRIMLGARWDTCYVFIKRINPSASEEVTEGREMVFRAVAERKGVYILTGVWVGILRPECAK